MSLLSINNLSIAYALANGRELDAITDFSLSLERGQIVGIVGQSGAGKSTIGKAVLGLLGENAHISGGEILLDGENLARFSERQFAAIRGKRVGYIYQNPMTALNPVLSVGEQLIEAIEANTDKRGQAARDHAIALLTSAEVSHPEQRLSKYPHQLSGGLCQRIVFAIAIAAQPDLIIADEPTTALDVTVQQAVLGTLKRLALQEQIAIILITHDMGVVSQMCDEVYVLSRGKLVEHGLTAEIIGAPRERYTRDLMAAIPSVDEKRPRFDVLDAFEDTPGRCRGIDFLKSGIAANPGQPVLLSVHDLSKTFKGDRRGEGFKALDRVSFEVIAGETFGIVGESGSGKSTIGRAILGLVEPDAGATIALAGRTIASGDRKGLSQRLQCIFQDPYSSLNPRMDAGTNIIYGLLAQRLVDRGAARVLAEDLLEVVGLPRAAAGKMPHAFSGGERQRIGIARALAYRPELIFCDEPTSALDVTVQAEVLNLLKELQESLGLTLVFVSHDLAVVRQMCDRLIVMKAGQIVERGSAEQVLTEPGEPYTRQLLAAMPRVLRSAEPS
ncbi:dipeptide ABC transporter ATP-binding protein [Devosia ginsengisoli]|uniref:ABC transporter ATP-binding protein n=1 Tax=Devosia ginsengisoli TaxID=400770 RepID=A0A5B8LWU4_9HYPH|nr:ABC transporter ATP-binding protein [Devosia ginsengisoli]QDZ11880.1 ABC transporter ATP-binding protein [Devosia ginsengisoli]